MVIGSVMKVIFIPGSTDPHKIFCTVGGAVTNDGLRKLCLENLDPFQHSYRTIP